MRSFCYLALLLYAGALACALDVCTVLKDRAGNLEATGETKWVDTLKGVDNNSCGAETFPCATLEQVLSQTGGYNVTIYVSAGSVLNRTLSLQNASLVSIVGDPERTEFQCTGVDSGLFAFQIVNSSQIHIANISFTNCGPDESNVFITGSTDVVFENCVFRDNTASSVLAYDSNYLAFVSCVFSENYVYKIAGISLYNNTAASPVFLLAQNRAGNFLILRSRFSNNFAIVDGAIQGYVQGGALNVGLFAKDSHVCIEGTLFEGNRADSSGGAIALTIGDGSSNSAVTVRSSMFSNNSCTHPRCSGGAVNIAIIGTSSYNYIEMNGTVFSSNNASTGGALTISSVDNVGNSDNDTALLVNCTFVHNTAYYDGTAFAVYSLVLVNEISLTIEVQDCNFTGNVPTYGQDSSALNIYHTLVTFRGRTLIFSNVGGGVSLLDSQMAVYGRVDIVSNNAVYGGGMSTSGRSLILMQSGSYLSFVNNSALQEGGALYIEYTSNAYFLTILNKNCFLQYYSNVSDIPPNQWNATIEFFDNVAGRGGAAIFSSDFSQCTWFGDIRYDGYSYIFLNQSNYTNSPFKMRGNKLLTESAQGVVNERSLASAPSALILTESVNQDVSYGEKVYILLQSRDQLNNSRESVYSVTYPNLQEELGSLSSAGGRVTYVVPSANNLQGMIGDTVNISITVTLLNNETSTLTVDLFVKGCHPGYVFNESKQSCVCGSQQMPTIITSCDDNNRYFYSLGYWVGVTANNTAYFGKTIPGFLNCTTQGLLQGCLFKYDNPEAQCAKGRKGTLCGQCIDGYGPTFDLQFCDNNCGAGGIVLYIVVCCIVTIFSVFVLHWDIKFPDELKGFIFYAQVIGLIYRSSSSQQIQFVQQNKFFSFMINMLGYALPFPVCLWKDSSVLLVSGLGIIPSVLATLVAFIYSYCAHHGNILPHRKSYSFHGFYFLYFFAYKYYLDASFVFISCQKLDATGKTVFTYNGNIECLKPPLVFLFIFGLLVALILGIFLPLYFLYLLYRRHKRVLQVYNVLTDGLKLKHQYIWYGIWGIWRRLPFIATSLAVAIFSQETILFIHCLLSLLCLLIVCIVQPYKKFYINVIEAFTLLCLFCATIALLDNDDVYIDGISTVGIIFTCLPFCFAGLYIIKLLTAYFWKFLNKHWKLNTRIKVYMTRVKSKLVWQKDRSVKKNSDKPSLHNKKIEGDEAVPSEKMILEDDASQVELREPLLQD